VLQDAPTFTALALSVGGLMLGASCLLGRVGARFGVPASLLFLAIGMLAGSDGPGGIRFERFDVAYLAGTGALVVILFAGGLQTPLHVIRGALAPAGVLATLGVVGVAGLTAVGARLLGAPWDEALLVGAIVSSTDAAAVFTVLQGVRLPERVARTIELESGLNDPVAVILATAMTANLLGQRPDWSWMPVEIAVQLVVGAACGLVVGYLGRVLFCRVKLTNTALNPVLSLALALVAYGWPTLVGGSGFMAVYLAGIVIGNSRLAEREHLFQIHESLAWLAQVGMFLMLGLLCFPARLPEVATVGVLLALFLAFFARPAVVSLLLLPFGFRWRETAFIAWAGLRGAVPIVIATVPVLEAEGQSLAECEALNAFEWVLFTVVVGTLLPGATLRWLARRLGLDRLAASAPVGDPTADVDRDKAAWTPAPAPPDQSLPQEPAENDLQTAGCLAAAASDAT
jgi:cell volume regulation protein A